MQDGCRIKLYNKDYRELAGMGIKCDVVLADLGFNSVQLEEAEGFSWNKETKLDMRYNRSKF